MRGGKVKNVYKAFGFKIGTIIYYFLRKGKQQIGKVIEERLRLQPSQI
jgi:hypothetical protein